MVLTVAFNAAVFLVCVALTTGFVLLVAWIYAPIAEAKRLAEEVDPVQEATYMDPNDGNHLYVVLCHFSINSPF